MAMIWGWLKYTPRNFIRNAKEGSASDNSERSSIAYAQSSVELGFRLVEKISGPKNEDR